MAEHERAKSGVQLPIAFWVEKGRTAHISEKLTRGESYLCPFCHGEVSWRKGSQRQPHFYHLAETNCSPSPETLLHEGAKVYLHAALLTKTPFPITINDWKYVPDELAEILKPLGITGLTISANTIPGFGLRDHELEKFGEMYRPDILSTTDCVSFYWEIYVSHAIDGEKEKWLKEQNIPFIELKPFPVEQAGYEFVVNALGGFSLLSTKAALFPLLFRKFEKEIYSAYQDRMDDGARKEIRESVFCSAVENARHDIMESISPKRHRSFVEDEIDRSDFALALGKAFSLEIYADEYERTDNQSERPFEKAEMDNSGKFPSIKINERYYTAGPVRLLGAIVQRLSELGHLKGIVNDKRQLIGVDLEYPTMRKRGKIKKRLLHSNDEVAKDGVEIEYVKGCKNKAGEPYCLVSSSLGAGYYVKNHYRLLIGLLCYLGRTAKVNVILQENANKYQTVVGIRIAGIPNRKEISGMLTDFFTAILEKLVENRPEP